MAYCNPVRQSHFEYVINELKDFNNQYPVELSVEELYNIDPVGYEFFRDTNVQKILAAVRQIHPVRLDRRDVLREMERIWRFNDQSRQVLNEQKYITQDQIRTRVKRLFDLTVARLVHEAKIENEVTSDIILAREYEIPLNLPVHTSGKLSSANRVLHPAIQDYETTPIFRPIPRRRRQ